ncbi:IS21 family transposase [Glycomyces sp. MUSA5-2]|uniref:IS21 family transposase n=1 Tax=Glycomyces sp. MUSA5-2 TaxID=2053002 RepID=UPI003009DC76
MKCNWEIMEILEAYDLVGSYRKAAELAGCDHHTVRRYVELRDQGVDPTKRKPRARLIDDYMPKIEELVERSQARIGADMAHKKIVAMGYDGSERTTRKAVAAAKTSYKSGHRRVFRPWIPEPGLWLQFDWGEGPRVDGRRTQLWCAWLAWSRFRVVIPVWDKTIPTIAACLDQTFRILGGVPTNVLTDNEKTVTVDHVARIPVRNSDIAQIGRHYSTAIRTCVPADPQSKGGAESTVRLAKRDLVPTEVNLRGQYGAFAALQEAAEEFCLEVNSRVHRETRMVPAEALLEERTRLHPVPLEPFAAAFGETRRVSRDSTISVGSVRYSVPHQLVDRTVWARFHGDDMVVTAMVDGAATEVARHLRSTPGRPQILDEHYPESSRGERKARPTSREEADFLALGPEAETWLIAAASAGTSRLRSKMRAATQAAALYGAEAVRAALEAAAKAERFEEDALVQILEYQRYQSKTGVTRATEAHSLQPGTSGWASFGTPAGR